MKTIGEEPGGLKPDLHCLSAAIDAVGAGGDWESAMRVLNDMRAAGIKPDGFVYRLERPIYVNIVISKAFFLLRSPFSFCLHHSDLCIIWCFKLRETASFRGWSQAMICSPRVIRTHASNPMYKGKHNSVRERRKARPGAATAP